MTIQILLLKENVIKKRICTYCQLYFGPIDSKEAHQKWCNSRPKSVATTFQEKQATHVSKTCEVERLLRSSRTKARRGVELLCLMKTHDLE